MRVAVAGGTGLVGRFTVRALTGAGYEAVVARPVRRRDGRRDPAARPDARLAPTTFDSWLASDDAKAI